MSGRDDLAQVLRSVDNRPVIEREDIGVYERSADAILAAGWRPPALSLQPGLYRNTLGAEVHVDGLNVSANVIGGTWWAHQDGGLFGTTRLLVTPQGMQDAGYETREELDALYGERAYRWRRIRDAEGDFTDADVEAFEESKADIDRWLAAHDEQVRREHGARLDELAASGIAAEARVVHRLEAVLERVRGLLAEVDGWTPYESRDTGLTFLAESVRDLVTDARRALDGGASDG